MEKIGSVVILFIYIDQLPISLTVGLLYICLTRARMELTAVSGTLTILDQSSYIRIETLRAKVPQKPTDL